MLRREPWFGTPAIQYIIKCLFERGSNVFEENALRARRRLVNGISPWVCIRGVRRPVFSPRRRCTVEGCATTRRRRLYYYKNTQTGFRGCAYVIYMLHVHRRTTQIINDNDMLHVHEPNKHVGLGTMWSRCVSGWTKK